MKISSACIADTCYMIQYMYKYMYKPPIPNATLKCTADFFWFFSLEKSDVI